MKKTLLNIYQKAPSGVKSVISSLYGYTLLYRRGKNRKQYIAEISKKDKWTKEQIAEWQKQELEKVLEHAVRNVPYYRKQWEEIWKQDPNISHLVLENWPVLEKKVIKENPDDFIADTHRQKKMYLMSTSGSTGTPMRFWLDREALSYWYAIFEYRILNLNGLSSKNNWANIGGQLICDINKKRPPFWSWNMAMRQLYFSSYHITPGNIKYYLKAIKDYKIQHIISYTSSVYNIAKEGLVQNSDFPALKGVITNAEALFDHQRIVIQQAFKCPVIQTYAGCEFAFGASETEEGLMYVWPEAGILEVIDDNGSPVADGAIGNFLATGFVNYAMPLIRYRIGDSGAYLPEELCSNKKLPYPVLKEVTGRNDDLIYTPEGKLVGRLDPIFKGDFHIKEAQVIQESIERIKILYTPLLGFTEQEILEVRNKLQERVGDKMTIILEQTDSIPRGANGKFKAVVSMVKRT